MVMVRQIGTLWLLAALLSHDLPAAAGVDVADEPVSTADATRIVTFVRNARWERVDSGNPGFSIGDLVVGSGDLSRRRGGVARGVQEWSALVTAIDPATARELRTTTVQYTWPRGSILTEKIARYPINGGLSDSVTYAIVGGTGEYAGVRGTARLKVLNEREFRVVFELQP
jgi:hypothetical protein